MWTWKRLRGGWGAGGRQEVWGQTRSHTHLVTIHPNMSGDFPGGPVVKNLRSSAGDTGLIPSRGAEIPHAVGQLRNSPSTTAK